MSRTELAIAAYLNGDLVSVRAAFGVAGVRGGEYTLDSDDSVPGSEPTINAYDPEASVMTVAPRKVAA